MKINHDAIEEYIMLNEYLSESELQKSLSEYLDSFQFMCETFETKNQIMIHQDKKRLAKLHHLLNIEKYSEKSFRQKLFLGAPDDLIIKFAKSCNVQFKSYNETLNKDFRIKLASFVWGNNDSTKNFVEIFSYPKYLIPTSNELFYSKEEIKSAEIPFKQLTDYQSKIVFKAYRHIEIPNSKFLIHMPTGSGKTRVAMEIISHFLNENKDKQVIWLADKKELCEQAMDTFINVWSHLAQRKIHIYRIWGDSDIPDQITGSAFVVAMYQKIRNPLKNLPNMKFDLIVPDEAHNAIASTYSNIIEKLSDIHIKQTRLMGLTATHGRGSRDPLQSKHLSKFFNSNVIDIDEDNVIEYLQKKKILSHCKRRPLNTNLHYNLTKQEWDDLSQNFSREFPDGLLQKIANDNRRNLIIIKELKKLTVNHKHILVFCGSVKQSKILSSFIGLENQIEGENAAFVDANSPPRYRHDVVKKFRDGKIKFLFNYGIFAAGFDVPSIDAIVITRPTTSMVLYGQMIGRGMRGPKMGGTSQFTLVDVIDNILTENAGLDDVYDYFSEYWEK